MKQYKEKISTRNDPDIAAYTLQYTSPKGIVTTASEELSVKSAITSGMVLNIKIARSLGGFDEGLFIDGVDTEYCYRVIQNNYKILMFSDILLEHHIGNPSIKRFFWGKVIPTNHNAIRRYYITRNNIVLFFRYHRGVNFLTDALCKEPIKILLYEPDKRDKIKAILFGVYDGLIDKMGKCKRQF